MEELLERARAYLSDLEADRNAALALSEQKAEEAKLIKARQEGFQAALELLSGETSAGNPASGETESFTLIAAAVSGHPISRKHFGGACAGRSAN
jgi:hypothetical protein